MSNPVIERLVAKLEQLPAERVAQVIDFVDFLRERTVARKSTTSQEPLEFPVDDLGPWPEGLSLRRADMYGDDGR